MFLVRQKSCETCIYRKDSCFDLKNLEDQVRDKYSGFEGFRACHHEEGKKVCCRGFWNRHKNKFQLGQIAQRLNLVKYVTNYKGDIK